MQQQRHDGHVPEHKTTGNRMRGLRLIPFFYVAFRIPVKTVLGTVRVGFGFLVRPGGKKWLYLLAAIAMLLTVFLVLKL